MYTVYIEVHYMPLHVVYKNEHLNKKYIQRDNMPMGNTMFF